MSEKTDFVIYLSKNWRKEKQSNLLVTTKKYRNEDFIKKLIKEVIGKNPKVLFFHEIEPCLSHRLFDSNIKKTISFHKYTLYTMSNYACAKFLYYEKIKKVEKETLQRIIEKERPLKTFASRLQTSLKTILPRRKRKRKAPTIV